MESEQARRKTVTELTNSSDVKGWQGDAMAFIQEAKAYRDRMQGPLRKKIDSFLLEITEKADLL
jgi:hypothetical protein